MLSQNTKIPLDRKNYKWRHTWNKWQSWRIIQIGGDSRDKMVRHVLRHKNVLKTIMKSDTLKKEGQEPNI